MNSSLSGVSVAKGEVDADMFWNALPVGSSVACYATIRQSSSGATASGYSLRLRLNPAGSIFEAEYRSDAGITGASTAEVQITAGYVPGTIYHTRLSASGSSLQGMAWADGASAPAAWQTSLTDGTYTSGFPGIAAYTQAGTTVIPACHIDSLLAFSS